MKYYELDKEEKEILEAFDKGEYVTIANQKAEIARLKKAANNTLNKARNINIRLSEKDLRKIKSKAIEQGIPYQTLIASVIHQYGAR
jgi:predicted DNA binding CopG/RHH family protein